MTTERRHDIDWLRVLAIGLLLIYHIAIIFQPWAMFIGFIRSNELLEGLWKPMTMLNVWRIPLLFYVSGMGLYFAMKKRSWRQLLLERTMRILLPFLFGIVAITPLHMFIFQKYYNMPLGYFPHQGHLWFLGNIFVYVLVLLPFFYCLKQKGGGKLRKGLSLVMGHPGGPLLLSLVFVLETIVVRPQLFAMYAQTWHGFFIGLLAFFFGFILMYSGEAFWKTVLKWRWLYFGMAVVLYGVRYIMYETEAPGYLMAIESNCWIFWVFGLGHKNLNRPSALLGYLSKAAYPVYIIHMFVLYAGALLILPLEIPVVLKFLAITMFTGIGCFVLYESVVRRIYFLGPLFGMKWTSRKSDKVQAPISIPNKEYAEN
ncbi:acyltransferase family protein [Maribacter polysaccharolyticus]|uniref:acyltransferase family protein n=1 Tax=Maribacter polysaccharolyticus TaxID=3020831 RepID=UPI00237F731A|nr:acyltransferase family protein [Maribacter polysaccharolyticus]MDE3741039.1 acyltransferase family protein [Maribacter polysaccharolyticus]